MRNILLTSILATTITAAGGAIAQVAPMDPAGSSTGMNQRDGVKQEGATIAPITDRVAPMDPAGSSTGMNQRDSVRQAPMNKDPKNSVPSAGKSEFPREPVAGSTRGYPSPGKRRYLDELRPQGLVRCWRGKRHDHPRLGRMKQIQNY